MAEHHLSPLRGALEALSAWLDAGGIAYTLVGGVAASILGRPRVTRDVDALLALDEPFWERSVRQGAMFGLETRRADALEFAREARVLLLRHAPTGVEIDLMLSLLPLEYSIIARASQKDISGLRLMLPTPEDLIIMKALARRPRDQEDIAGLIAMHPHLNRAFILDTVRTLSEELGDPPIIEGLQALLSGSP